MTTAAEVLRKAEAKAKREALELELKIQLVAARASTGMVREYQFHPTRRWRFDFAWPGMRLAAEVEGISPNAGRHQRVAGYTSDCEKYNAAQLAGWVVLRFTGNMVKDGTALRDISDALSNRWRLEKDRAG